MEPTQFARLFRAEHGRILAAMLRYTKDLDIIEDAIQDACVQALGQWPSNGQPDNLSAWLLTVTKRRLIDRMRRHEYLKSHPDSQKLIDAMEAASHDDSELHSLADNQLKLIFTCCHPALSREARVALTLKTLGGLSAREIARAFLTSESTMLQRITRAKQKIKRAAIPYQIPEGAQLTERLPSVLEVIYLIYNESHTAMTGQTLSREELAAEALRLAELVHNAMATAEVSGLLALMLFHEARRVSRQNSQHDYVPLALQDRSRWDHSKIERAHQLLSSSLPTGPVGPYQIQAAISGLHARAASWQQTDWRQIYALYQLLSAIQPSPVIALNKWVALAYSGNVLEGYQQLIQLAPELCDYQPFFAAKAELARRLAKYSEAIEAYERAIRLSHNPVEKGYLTKQLESCTCSGAASDKD